jgi:hypothetical protein
MQAALFLNQKIVYENDFFAMAQWFNAPPWGEGI